MILRESCERSGSSFGMGCRARVKCAELPTNTTIHMPVYGRQSALRSSNCLHSLLRGCSFQSLMERASARTWVPTVRQVQMKWCCTRLFELRQASSCLYFLFSLCALRGVASRKSFRGGLLAYTCAAAGVQIHKMHVLDAQ